MSTILIAEEDPQLRVFLGELLERYGYVIFPAGNSAEVVEIARNHVPDLIILEWTMPGLSRPRALARLRSSRADGGPQLLILSRRSGEDDRVSALTSSADDYLVKPCSPAELMARVRALLRRGPVPPGSVLKVGAVELHLLSSRAFREGERIELSATQFSLLKQFVRNPHRILTCEHLKDALFKPTIHRRTIKVHIRRLRDALNQSGRANLFRTVPTGGYVFEPDGVPVRSCAASQMRR